MRFTTTRTVAALAIAFASLAAVGAASAANVSGLRIDQPVQAARGPANLGSRTVDYVVTLSTPSVAKAVKDAGKLSKDQQKAQGRSIKVEQDKVADRVRQLGGKEIARVDKALNAIVVSLDARRKAELEQTEGVQTVRPVNRYELDLSETVPYIGAAALQAGGNFGSGIRVAVLDSGIDYTHVAMGGAGSADAYAAAYGTSTADSKNKTLDGLFPTPKVIGGYDFVGEVWPNGDLEHDPDPIDCGNTAISNVCAGGHGTHVADIIGGVTPGARGVAPGVWFYAVKVCSAVSTACSGVALLQGVDFALDPNGDGDISDHVDVINLSLGSSYGQEQDDLTAALNSAADAGVVVVASAGNSADRPYIVGSPSSGKNVISVAQTQVPSALAFPLVVTGISPSAINNTATVDWAPIGAGFSGAVARLGRGCPAGSIAAGSPADPYFNSNSPAGKVALIDRGSCSVSLKVDRATKDGAVAVIIANNAAGDPPTFSFGGGDLPMVPTVIISQADGNRIKTALGATGVNPAVVASMSSASSIALVRSVVASSSRGPSYSYNSIKPDIGAPGASVSAIVGTGNETEAFGGTSGAAPMVTGSAALLLKARPGLSPAEVKSLLMNTAETTIYTNPATQPGVLAPITRIGGGEVRVNTAVASRTAAWDKDAQAGSLSFGYSPLAKQAKLKKKVVVQNYGSAERTYKITPGFRFANDAASGAVTVNAPSSLKVPAGKSREFDVELTIAPSLLNVWTLNGGSSGGNGSLLQTVEVDGYINIDGGPNNAVHVAWQVLPHRAADVSADAKKVNLKKDGTAELKLKNKSDVLDGNVDVFALTGQSPEIKKKLLPQPGDNFAVVDLKAVGVRYLTAAECGVPCVQFAIDTYGARAHPNYPAEFDVYIDADGDGNFDHVIYNLENGGFAVSGQNVVAAGTLASQTVSFFADADLNSGNMILTAPLSALGLTPGTTFNFSVYAFDNYFTGNQTDAIEGMTFTLDTPRFAASDLFPVVPKGGNATLGVQAVAGGDAKSPSQTGFLLMYRDAEGKSRKDVGKEEAQAIEVKGKP